nr:NB-ARC domains-containing protein [Tanacetum cinerariifolium]
LTNAVWKGVILDVKAVENWKSCVVMKYDICGNQKKQRQVKLKSVAIGVCKKLSLLNEELGNEERRIEAATNWSQLSNLHLPLSLTRHCIESFDNLEIVSEGLQHLTSLQHLTIHRCPKIKDLPETLLPSLLSLEIWGCPNLKELPVTLLHSLLSLDIRKFPDLKERCSRGGPYWPQISHIPCINIDYKSQT